MRLFPLLLVAPLLIGSATRAAGQDPVEDSAEEVSTAAPEETAEVRPGEDREH